MTIAPGREAGAIPNTGEFDPEERLLPGHKVFVGLTSDTVSPATAQNVLTNAFLQHVQALACERGIRLNLGLVDLAPNHPMSAGPMLSAKVLRPEPPVTRED